MHKEIENFQKLLSVSIARKEAFSSSSTHGVYLFGAGFVGAWALSYLTQIGEKVIAFVDSSVDRQGTTFMGLPVIALEQLKRNKVNQIIITSRHYIDEIRRTIQNYLGKDREDGGGNVLTIDEFVILQCGQEKINKCA
jgi:FlaA1/EpsC-like NDP-sugar epimerase